MRFLLDTHSFLWAVFNPGKLSRPARETLRDTENDVFVSVVTFWEVALKYGLGKIELTGAQPEDLPRLAEEMAFDILSIRPDEAASFYRLPTLAHKDPFDRLIIWQSIQQKMILI